MARLLFVVCFLAGLLTISAWVLVRTKGQADERAEEARRLAQETRDRAVAHPVRTVPAAGASTGRDDLRAELGRVHAALERIEARLDALETRPAGARAPAATAPAGSDEQLRILRDLQESVALLMALQEDPELGLQRIRQARPEADWSSLGVLLALWDSDVEQARKEVQLLSEAEVLRRYGSPDLTFGHGDGTRWVYGQGFVPERDAYELQLTFEIRDGLVRQFFVERL